MTNEERQKLCTDLRKLRDKYADRNIDRSCDAAADEIERLAALTQSNAEPVDEWSGPEVQKRIDALAAPPRPDASEPKFALDEIEASLNRALDKKGFPASRPDASGLIEAAELAEEEAKKWTTPVHIVMRKFAADLRSRAADRGTKSAPPRPDASGLIEDFRKKAEECYAAYKKTRDIVEAAAGDVYNECADALSADRSNKGAGS